MHILSFRPEIILYIYMASCIALLVFNILYILLDKYQNQKFRRRNHKFEQVLLEQMKLAENGTPPDQKHRGWLKRKLSRVGGLRSFEYSMAEASLKAPENAADEYIRQMRTVFLELSEVYARRDTIEKAYFASIIERFRIDRGRTGTDAVIEFLKQLVISTDVYARENALRALQSIGDLESMIDVWDKMQANGIHHSVKLLADGLMRFSGDRKQLAGELMKRLDGYDVELALSVMQFARFSDGSFCQKIWKVVKDDNADKELRLEGIRYLGKYKYEPAKDTLMQFINLQEFLDWEYAAMAASSLASYPGADTEACLKGGLGASIWHVRINCANALVCGLKVPQSRLFDIYNGKDRYAREILRYATEKEEMKSRGMEG